MNLIGRQVRHIRHRSDFRPPLPHIVPLVIPPPIGVHYLPHLNSLFVIFVCDKRHLFYLILTQYLYVLILNNLSLESVKNYTPFTGGTSSVFHIHNITCIKLYTRCPVYILNLRVGLRCIYFTTECFRI